MTSFVSSRILAKVFVVKILATFLLSGLGKCFCRHNIWWWLLLIPKIFLTCFGSFGGLKQVTLAKTSVGQLIGIPFSNQMSHRSTFGCHIVLVWYCLQHVCYCLDVLCVFTDFQNVMCSLCIVLSHMCHLCNVLFMACCVCSRNWNVWCHICL